MKWTTILCFLGLIASCGDNEDDEILRPEQEQQRDQGVYEAVLVPINPTINGMAEATIRISVTGDEFQARTEAHNLEGAVLQRQFVYAGGACPTAAHDANKDGLLDQGESLERSRGALIPLDTDLSRQAAGEFPATDGSGQLNYASSTSLENLVNDLRGPDENQNDDVVKLGPDERLNLSGRVVMIHGLAGDRVLPETVPDRGELSAEETFPILCGVLRRK